MSEAAFGSLFKKYALAVCLDKFSPHSFRHASATHMMKNGGDIRALQYFLGHRDIGSTAVYAGVDGMTVRSVVDKMVS